MKIYLVTYGERDGEQKVESFFFKRSAISRVKRRLGDAHYKESGEGLWVTKSMFVSILAVTLQLFGFSLMRWIKQRCHWQNLNEKKDGTTGSMFKHGRAWIYSKWEDERAQRRKELHLEWSLFTKFWALEFSVGTGDADDGLSLWVACGLFSLHVSFEGILSRKFVERMQEKAKSTKGLGYAYMALPRSTGVKIHGNTIWFEIWNTEDWSSEQPKWMSFNFGVVDFLFGKEKYETKVVAESTGEIILSDGVHSVKIQLTEDSWKRPRLPKPMIVRRARIESEKGIPVPGKGENSWDCDDDAIFSSTFPADSFDAALNHLRESVLKTRQQYGGANWLPSHKSA
jgi:hypothetical protein